MPLQDTQHAVARQRGYRDRKHPNFTSQCVEFQYFRPECVLNSSIPGVLGGSGTAELAPKTTLFRRDPRIRTRTTAKMCPEPQHIEPMMAKKRGTRK